MCCCHGVTERGSESKERVRCPRVTVGTPHVGSASPPSPSLRFLPLNFIQWLLTIFLCFWFEYVMWLLASWDFAKSFLDVPDMTRELSGKVLAHDSISVPLPWSTALGFRFGRGTLLPGGHQCWHWNRVQGKCHQYQSYHLFLNWIWGIKNPGKKLKITGMYVLRLYTSIQIHSPIARYTLEFKNSNKSIFNTFMSS